MVLDQEDELDVNGKTIVCRLTQWDLLALNVEFMPRLGTLWAGLLLLSLGAGSLVVLSDGVSELARTLLVLASAAALLGALASMAGFLFAIGIVSSSPVHNPLLIDHSYTFEREGLLTRTGDHEAFIEWSRVRDVRRTRRFILIDVAPGLYHALPRRSFRSSREYQAFWSATRRCTSAALAALP
jgi:hypothetical protein